VKKRHERKRFYIVGEGVYESDDDHDDGGKLIVEAAAADAAAGAPQATFRFSRIAPANDEQLSGQTRKTLA
jgi:hypothetical protein